MVVVAGRRVIDEVGGIVSGGGDGETCKESPLPSRACPVLDTGERVG